jgi:hypothetical protein
MRVWNKQEVLRPWKLITFSIGLAIMILGSFTEHISDWDLGISLIMCTLTYLTAPFAVRTVLRRQWRDLPLAIFLAYFTIDGCYWIYHTLMGNVMIREGNAYASTPLYFFMGMVWVWEGSLRELVVAVRGAVKRG